jgi:hypothetical protein
VLDADLRQPLEDARVPPPEVGRRVTLRWRAPLAVAAARLRASPGRALLVVLGIAAAVATLVAVLGGSLVARDRAVQDAIRELPLSERSFRVDAFGLPPGTTYAQADRAVVDALRPLAPGVPLRATVFRALSVDRELVQLAGVDGLDRLARLRSGRLPRTCRPERCEVLQVGATGRAELDEGDIHLRRVGIADLPARGILGSAVRPGSGPRPVLLLAAAARSFDGVPAFAAFYRLYSWIAPLDAARVHVWDVPRILARETRAQASLAARSDVYALGGPDEALVDARSRGRVSASRLVLVGGELSALLLGFALVAAMGLRRGLADERRRLLQRGATQLQAWGAGAAEVTVVTLAGTIAGCAGGVVAVVLVAGAADAPRGALLEHALGSTTAVGLVAGAWIAATAAVLVAVATGGPAGRRRRIRPLDVAALGAAAAVAVGLSRGGLRRETLSSGGASTLLLLLPGLICFVAAVAAARLLGPATRLAERAARSAPAAIRLALLALARAPARTAASAAFLVASLGLAFFAASYGATLAAGARDEAAFAVPLDFSLTEGPRLVRPLEAGPTTAYARLAAGTAVYPVVRRTASVAGVGAGVLSPTVLGLAPAAVERLRWRSDFSSEAPATLARRLGADGPAALAGAAVPRGAATVSAGVRVRGAVVRLDLAVRDHRGRTHLVPLGQHGPGASRLAARLPAGVRTITALEVSLGRAQQGVLLHATAEGASAFGYSGSLAVAPLRAGGRVLTWHGWLARGADRAAAGRSLRLRYSFVSGQTIVVRRPQPTDRAPLRVVVSPAVARSAGPGGRLTLEIGPARMPARVVAVARRFPAAEQSDEGFVIADESRLATALEADAPGTGAPDELWLSVPERAREQVAAALRRPPFSALAVASRAAVERRLAHEPLAHATTLTLAAAALVALVLAAVGLSVAVASELRDERAELFDLEAQGVGPDTLRAQFRARAAALVVLGAAGGSVVGWLLSRLVVAFVRVSASTGDARPPLRLDASWTAALAGLGGLLVAVVLAVELATRLAFRDESPRPAAGSVP